jgi:AraC-like DNA-binding protein
LPETPLNAGFRKSFFSRWGKENSVFVAATRRAGYGPIATAMSFKTVLHGKAQVTLGRRRLLLEPGLFLPVNAGGEYSVCIDSPVNVQCFSVHFQPELAAAVAAAQPLDWTEALECQPKARATPLLHESLRPLDTGLQSQVQRMALGVGSGHTDPMALEQEFVALLHLMLRTDAQRRRHALEAVPTVRPNARLELLRRVEWAADYMLSTYAEDITLDDIAQAARLSKYHLLRAFRQIKQCTPHQFLRARRVEVARRLLQRRELGLEAVAAAAGFGSRWTMQRALRLHLGQSGAALRGAACA